MARVVGHYHASLSGPEASADAIARSTDLRPATWMTEIVSMARRLEELDDLLTIHPVSILALCMMLPAS